MNATRLYTLKYGQNRQILSIGRVQTPTLALIVKRQQEIENFTPQQYWVLATLYRETTFSAIIRKSDEELAQEESDAKENPKKAKRLKRTGEFLPSLILLPDRHSWSVSKMFLLL